MPISTVRVHGSSFANAWPPASLGAGDGLGDVIWPPASLGAGDGLGDVIVHAASSNARPGKADRIGRFCPPARAITSGVITG